MTKQVAILGPTSATDVWNIPISFYNCFVNLGHTVKFYNTLIDNKFNDKNLLQLIEDYNNKTFIPDIILHLDFGLFSSTFLDKKYVPTAKWIVESGDDPQNYRLNLAKIKNKNFDIVLSPDIRCVEGYNKQNIKAVWCPYFADPNQFDIEQNPIYDAVTTRSVEEPFFKELKERLKERFEARTTFLQGKEHSIHLMKGLMVVQNSKYKEITRRIFEGMMANRLVITDRPDPSTRIDLIFKENEDIVYFDTIDECIEKINYYSKNTEERLRISNNGHNKVKTKHTVTHRVTKLLSIL